MAEVVGEKEVDNVKWERRQRRWTDNFLRQIRRYHKNMWNFFLGKLLSYMYKISNLGKSGTLAILGLVPGWLKERAYKMRQRMILRKYSWRITTCTRNPKLWISRLRWWRLRRKGIWFWGHMFLSGRQVQTTRTSSLNVNKECRS